MSPEERELLLKSVQLAEENNKILHSLRKSARISNIMSFLYWVFIIGASLGLYYFIEPYVDQLVNVYSSAKSSLNGVNSVVGNLKNVSDGAKNGIDNVGSLLKDLTN